MDKEVDSDFQLAQSFFEFIASSDKSLRFVADRIDSIIAADPQRGWRLTLQLVAAAPDDFSLSVVAAGPLENLLVYHGSVLIDDVELQARCDPRLLLALSSLWGTFPTQLGVRARLKRLLEGSNLRWNGRDA